MKRDFFIGAPKGDEGSGYRFNDLRLLELIGNIPPEEFKEVYYQNQKVPVVIDRLKWRRLQSRRGGRRQA